jgi:hypothetical protein
VANLYLVVRRAASAHNLSFPYAGKDFVFLVAAYSQTYGLASSNLTLVRLRQTVPSPQRKGSRAIDRG